MIKKDQRLGQNPTFYPDIPYNLILEKCEFCEKWDFENVNFVKIVIVKMWIFGWFTDFCPSVYETFWLDFQTIQNGLPKGSGIQAITETLAVSF